MNKNMKKQKKIKEIILSQLPFKPVSMFFGGLRSAVFKKDDGTFGIRIKIGESWRGQNVSESWDYFELDKEGVIVSSPRGYAGQFNKKTKIINIEKAVQEYKDKITD